MQQYELGAIIVYLFNKEATIERKLFKNRFQMVESLL